MLKKSDGYLPINIVQFDKPAFTSENSNDERQQIKVWKKFIHNLEEGLNKEIVLCKMRKV